MTFKFLSILFFSTFIFSACANDSGKPKITCVKVKELADFETITWEKTSDLISLVDKRFDKEIMGKQFGEQNYCTLTVTIKNTSCYTSKFTVEFHLTTFTNKEEKDSKTKELKPGEEAEIKSTPFEIKNADDISDKSFEVKTDYIRKKTKVTYEKECVETDKKCKCDAQYDDPDASKILTVVKEEPLKCEEEVKAVVQGQIGENTEGGKKTPKKKK